jgi:hypothetical protein
MSKGFVCSWKRTLTADMTRKPNEGSGHLRAKKLVGLFYIKLLALYALEGILFSR